MVLVCFKTKENDQRSYCNNRSRLFGLSIFRGSVTICIQFLHSLRKKGCHFCGLPTPKYLSGEREVSDTGVSDGRESPPTHHVVQERSVSGHRGQGSMVLLFGQNFRKGGIKYFRLANY